MSLDAAFLEYMTQEITVAKFASENAHGDRSFSTSTTTHKARIQFKQHLTVNSQGQEVVARGLAFLGASSSGVMPGLTPTDQVTLPDGTTPPILSVDRFADSDAQHEAAHLG